MVEPEMVELARNLSRLSKILAHTSSDIVIELHSPQRAHELAGLLEEAARELRARALAAPPAVIEMPPDLGSDGSR